MNGANNYFTWKGINSSALGIYAKELPAPSLPAERVSYVTVPGRSGSLTIREGEDEYDYIYDDVVKSVICYIKNTDRYDDIASYLKGSGMVYFPDRPGGFYNARITNQIDMTKIVRGKPNSEFTVEFTCEPFWYSAAGQNLLPRITTNNTNINNPSDMFSEPEIGICGTGTVTVVIGLEAMEINFPSAGSVVYLDSKLKMAYHKNNNIITGLANSYVTLESGFPRLRSGVNGVAWTGSVSWIDIRPRWRWR